MVWAPKPDKAPYLAPNKPHVKLADLLKKHAHQQSWAETVVRDAGGLTGRYIQMAPGEKTKTQFYVDSSMFFIVEAGQMRVTLSGQEPFVATKGFIVQVPARIQYKMEADRRCPRRCASRSAIKPCPALLSRKRNADTGQGLHLYEGDAAGRGSQLRHHQALHLDFQKLRSWMAAAARPAALYATARLRPT